MIYKIAEKYSALSIKYRYYDSWHTMLPILLTAPSMVKYTLNVSIKSIRIWIIDERKCENWLIFQFIDTVSITTSDQITATTFILKEHFEYTIICFKHIASQNCAPFLWGVIIHPFNNGLGILPLNLWHGLVIEPLVLRRRNYLPIPKTQRWFTYDMIVRHALVRNMLSRKWAPFISYNDVIMDTITSQITSLTIVYSTVYSDADQRKHQSSASLAFVRRIHRWPVNSPHKWPVTRKMLPFDDVIMSLCFRDISLSQEQFAITLQWAFICMQTPLKLLCSWDSLSRKARVTLKPQLSQPIVGK